MNQKQFRVAEMLRGIRSIYLAGPMRYFPRFNVEAFTNGTALLRALGYEVWSSLEADMEIDGFNPYTGEGLLVGKIDGVDIEAYMARDLPKVREMEAIVLLPGWQQSRGACRELAEAVGHGRPAFELLFGTGDAFELRRAKVFKDLDKGVTDGEVRVKDPTTGGEKGQKLCRPDLLPMEPLMQVATHYGVGAKKYSLNNWRKGYAWSLSFAALMRHALQFWNGDDDDQETGSSHMAAVVFHAFALMEFRNTHPELDDRPGKDRQK